MAVDVVAIDGDLAMFAGGDRPAQRIDDGDLVAGVGLAQAARAGGPFLAALADDGADLDLAEGLVGLDPQGGLALLEQRRAGDRPCGPNRLSRPVPSTAHGGAGGGSAGTRLYQSGRL